MKFLKIISAILFFSFVGSIHSELKAQQPKRKDYRTSTSTGTLKKGAELKLGESLYSPNNTAVLRLENDGDLVIYMMSGPKKIWQSTTGGRGVAKLIFDSKGTLKLIDDAGGTVKGFGGENNPTAQTLQLTDLGDLFINATDGTTIWSLFRQRD